MGIFDMMHSFLNPDQGYKEAGDTMNDFWQQMQKYLQPYQQAGMDQIGTLTGAENKLLDPAQLENEWASGYSKSPYAQQMQKEAASAGMDSASQQGLVGSSSALQNVQNSSANIMNSDRQQYLKDLMEKYMGGIGIGKNIFNTGASAAGMLGQGALTSGQNIGAARLGQANAPGELLQKILGTAGGMYSGYKGWK